MPSLKIAQAGPYMSVQDTGRPGYLRSGIARGGAIDQGAIEEGRLLVGNQPGLAALEMLGLGGRFECLEDPLCLALTGTVFAAKIEDRKIKPYSSFILQSGQVLEIGAAESGNYGYLSVAGGIDTDRVLGSRSTHVKAGFGGFQGRCLRSDDVLPIGAAGQQSAGLNLPVTERGLSLEVRILWSAQTDLFSKEELQRFVETRFEMSHEMDRMGARLLSKGEPIHSKEGLVALSGAIAAGDIQVPGSGRPIVLLADRQPTGGYPRIATIIAADLADFAQRPAGSFFKFRPVSENDAVEALIKCADRLKKLPDQLRRSLDDPFDSYKLLSKNLISGVVSSDERK